jgi:hypothetical protein
MSTVNRLPSCHLPASRGSLRRATDNAIFPLRAAFLPSHFDQSIALELSSQDLFSQSFTKNHQERSCVAGVSAFQQKNCAAHIGARCLWKGKEGPRPGRDRWGGRAGEGGRKKPPPVPCLALLRTRIVRRVPQRRVLDPTTRWACKRRLLYWLPAGTPSVLQKQRRSRTPQRSPGLEGLPCDSYHAVCRRTSVFPRRNGKVVGTRPDATMAQGRTSGEDSTRAA